MEYKKVTYSIVKIGEEWIAESLPVKIFADAMVEYKNLKTKGEDYNQVNEEMQKLIDSTSAKSMFNSKPWRF